MSKSPKVAVKQEYLRDLTSQLAVTLLASLLEANRVTLLFFFFCFFLNLNSSDELLTRSVTARGKINSLGDAIA